MWLVGNNSLVPYKRQLNQAFFAGFQTNVWRCVHSYEQGYEYDSWKIAGLLPAV